MVDSSAWPKYPLTQLLVQVESARENGKYVFVQDLSERANVFFQYKGKLVEFNKEVMKVMVGRQTKEQALEDLRKAFVNAMRIGDTLAIDLGDLDINFQEYTSDSIFPTAKVLDFENARKRENYEKWVKPEEKHGFDGVVNGVFCMQDKF